MMSNSQDLVWPPHVHQPLAEAFCTAATFVAFAQPPGAFTGISGT